MRLSSQAIRLLQVKKPFNVRRPLRGSSFNDHLDYKRTGSINIAKGKPVNGVFHTPHTWSMRSVASQESNHSNAPAVVRNVD